MKNRMLLLLLNVSVMLPLLAVSAGAQCAVKTFKVRVPFDFTIRERQFPAGAYTFQKECEFLYLRNPHFKVLGVFLAFPEQNASQAPASKLIFFRYDGVHVLSSVLWQRDTIASVLTSPGHEVEVATRTLPASVASAGPRGRP